MEISAINNVSISDNIKRSKLDIVPSDIETASNQQVQQQSQGLPESKENVTVSEEQIQRINKVIEQANKTLAGCSTKLEFSIHEPTKEIMVKVLNADTGEVIKEIPSQKTLDRLAMVLEEIGWIVDKKV